jgi:two-component system, OmpR family, sensor histidine kinase TctE
MSRGHSLRVRLVGAMIFIFAAGLLASFIAYGLEINKRVSDLQASTLQQQAGTLLGGLAIESDGSVRLQVPPSWRQAYADSDGQFTYTLYDAQERAVALSPNLSTPLPFRSVPQGATYAPIGLIANGPEEAGVLAMRAPQGYVLVVARRGMESKRLVDSLFEEASEQLLVLWPFAALALVLTWIITWWSLRPVTRASRDAAAVGPADLDRRISAHGLPREVLPMVEAVNSALDRLAAAYAAERQITADAAHELRTPLSVLSLRLQRARDTGRVDWPAVEHDLAQITQVVAQLLDLARKEAPSHRRDIENLPVVNLSRAVREAAAMVVPLLEARGRQLELDVPDKMPLHGDADDLRDLVRNLLENALLHGRGTVKVVVRRPGDAQQSGITLDVSDEGEGVPIGKEEEIFARFRKLRSNSPGAGLGLAIVRQVARSHGGEVRFTRARGQVIVHFPASIAD